VEGFAKECAVVTHHRLEPGPDGGLVPAAPLEEPLVIRPTSETIIGAMYAKWLQSYRDLPILINQWANVVRWEMRTRLFLRTTEFLWQEGHTAHATEKEAREETMQMLRVYADFAENYMAMPVILGEKTAGERFPGAVATYSIEAMMQDRKALQAGTSHFLGQNFAHAQEIKFQDENGEEVYAWTTSWGVSTRLVGGVVMTHADDDGMVVPPRLAPKHAVILPIYRTDQDRSRVLEYCHRLTRQLQQQRYDDAPVRVWVDDRDLRGGEKNWQHIKRGVPLRMEIGPRDVQADAVFLGRRDQPVKQKQSVPRTQIVDTLPAILEQIQQNLYQRALTIREQNTHSINSLDDFRDFFTPQRQNKPEIHGGFALCHWQEHAEIDELLKELKVTIRCLPLEGEDEPGQCLFTGRLTPHRAIFAKAY
jgi:prolyl-tRNA synthetase